MSYLGSDLIISTPNSSFLFVVRSDLPHGQAEDRPSNFRLRKGCSDGSQSPAGDIRGLRQHSPHSQKLQEAIRKLYSEYFVLYWRINQTGHGKKVYYLQKRRRMFLITLLCSFQTQNVE